MIRALIVDDEPFAREDLMILLDACEDVRVVGEAGTIEQAREVLEAKEVDLVFLDIQLRGGTGFDLVPKIPLQVGIVFITAHDRHAVRAFEINALDYILKPVTLARLQASIGRALQAGKQAPDPSPVAAVALDPAGPQSALLSEDQILLKSDSHQLFVRIGDILAITSIGGNYTRAHLLDKESIVVRKTFKSWESLLPPDDFLRIHRSQIINAGRIHALHKKGERLFVEVGGIEEQLAVSKPMARRVSQLFEKRSVSRDTSEQP